MLEAEGMQGVGHGGTGHGGQTHGANKQRRRSFNIPHTRRGGKRVSAVDESRSNEQM